MTEPIKSDPVAYSSSPYLNAYLQKQRLAQVASEAEPKRPVRLERGNVVAYEVQPTSQNRAERVNGEAGADHADFSGHTNGGAVRKQWDDRPSDRLHQFEAERGIDEEQVEGDPNPYDDSGDDTSTPGMKPRPDAS